MKAAVDILEERIGAAMAAVAGRDDCAAIVRPATDAKFGDYQANGVMGLAKKLKTNPRKLAEEVVKNLDLSDICKPPEVAGPGFINLRLKAEFVADEATWLSVLSEDECWRLRVPWECSRGLPSGLGEVYFVVEKVTAPVGMPIYAEGDDIEMFASIPY